MKLFFRRKSTLDRVIDSIEETMLEQGPTSVKYHELAMCLIELLKAKADNKKGISWDTGLIVAGNLVGIILVLKHEKIDIIASKAFGLILKGRV